MITAYSNGQADQEIKYVKAWQLPFLVVWNKLWNLCRRPLVKVWQQDIVHLAAKIKTEMTLKLMPVIYDHMRSGCAECSWLYSFLRAQPFTSQIEQALRTNYCRVHAVDYLGFYTQYEQWFVESHVLSDKVCGFKSNRK